jgi:alkaline phosphatase
MAGPAAAPLFAADPQAAPAVRLGLITDLHYADKPPAGSRHYRETIGKLQEAIPRLEAAKVDRVVELGDFIDQADSVQTELGYLKRIHKELAALKCPHHYVLGNHCVATLRKQEFLDQCGVRRSYDSFDQGGFHFVTLDACFRGDYQPYGRNNFDWKDTNLAPDELEWLAEDLKKASDPTVVFVHQRLDVGGAHGIKNAPAARKILEQSKRVLAVFQGHSHQNDYRQLQGIHYCTLAAMIEGSGEENNAYSTLELFKDRSLKLSGFRRQKSYSW